MRMHKQKSLRSLHFRSGKNPHHSAGLSSAARNLTLCPHSIKTVLLPSLTLSYSLSLVRQTPKSRCISGVNSGIFLNVGVVDNCCPYGHPIAILRYLSMQQMACLRILLLCCDTWPIHQTGSSVSDSNLLNGLSRPGKRSFAFSQLDTLYIHIMSQMPSRILLSAQFLLYFVMFYSTSQATKGPSSAAVGCCLFGISESTFRDICHHLHAVIAYEVSFDTLSSIDPRIDFTRSFYDQDQWFRLGMSIRNHLLSVHGLLRFYHKSFYDFLRDPARSGIFCVNPSAFHIKLFHHLIKQHHHCASTYAIDGSSTYFPALYLILDLLF